MSGLASLPSSYMAAGAVPLAAAALAIWLLGLCLRLRLRWRIALWRRGQHMASLLASLLPSLLVAPVSACIHCSRNPRAPKRRHCDAALVRFRKATRPAIQLIWH